MKQLIPTIPFSRALHLAAAILIFTTGLIAQEREPKLDPQGELDKIEQVHREGREDRINRQSGEDIRGRQEWFAFQRRFPYDMIPAGTRLAAIREVKRQEEILQRALRDKRDMSTILGASRWENIGPSNFSGRIRAIAIHPTDPDILYVGAAAGGLWKTTNGGQLWTTTTDTLTSLAVCAIAIDHTNPNIIYIGTGENTSNIDAYEGDGLFKSTDGGLTWKNIGLNNVPAFSKLHVNKLNPNIVYAAAARRDQGGFFRSEDGGETWTKALNGDAYDLTVNPSNNNELIVAFRTTLRKSTDAGKTWTAVTTGMNLTSGLRISIAMAPSNPQRVYALVARDPGNGGNHIGEVYRSTNGGTNWTLAKTMQGSFFNKQGWYDNCIGVDHTDANRVLIGGIDIFQSTDGGTNWRNTTNGYTGGHVHVDQHVIEFDPGTPGLAFIGNDGGVYRSLDGGSEWQHISTSLPTSQYYAMEVDQTKLYRVYGGTQDNGTHGSYGTSGPVQNWEKILGGDGFFVVVDESNPDIIYAEQFNGTPLYRIDATNTNLKTRIDFSISPDSDQGDIGFWSTPIAMSPADKKSLYTGRTGLYRSTNRGSNWQKLTPGNLNKITAIGLSPTDANKLMIGTATGELRYSTDYGVNWSAPTGVPAKFVTDVVYDPVDPNRIYVSFSGTGANHVYRSDDNGATFVDITENLPRVPVNAIAVDPRNNNHVFVGTDVGVFVSLDAGTFWFPFNDGLALSPVVDLKIHRTTHNLIAATHGRSMFKVNISTVEPQPVLITPIGGQTVSTPGALPIRWFGFNGPVRIYISYDGGRTFHLVADNVNGSGDTLTVQPSNSDNVRIRIEEIGSGRVVESSDFKMTATLNGGSLGRRAGIITEVIEYRRGHIWASVRNTDSLYKFRLPALSGERVGLRYTNISGRVHDMAYDEARDLFYVLTVEGNSSKLFRMDSNGVGQGEVPLLEEIGRVDGVAMVNDGIAVITDGATPEVYVITDAGALVRKNGALVNGSDPDRSGFVWDGSGFVQAVSSSALGINFPTRLEHVADENPLRVRESTSIVVQPPGALHVVGLAFDPTNSSIDKRVYWATDTTGAFFRFEREKFFTSGVEIDRTVSTGYTSREVALSRITPNPMRGETEITFTARSRRAITIDIYDGAGVHITSVFDGMVEPGEHSIRFDGHGLASGVYYVTLSGGAGERDVRPVVVVK